MDSTRSGRRTRRAASAVVLTALLVMAACGGDDDDTGGGRGAGFDDGRPRPVRPRRAGSSATSAGGGAATRRHHRRARGRLRPRRGAAGRHPARGRPGGLHFDPTATVINADEAWLTLIYGTLVRPNDEGGFDPWLAESVEIVDPTTITVTLRDGHRLQRRHALRRRGGEGGHPAQPEPARLPGGRRPAGTPCSRSWPTSPSSSPLELTFTLEAPVAGEFISVLAGRESAVPSPKAIADGVNLDTRRWAPGRTCSTDYRPNEIDVAAQEPRLLRRRRVEARRHRLRQRHRRADGDQRPARRPGRRRPAHRLRRPGR